MERDEDKQLWDLLGRNKAPGPSPFFARSVLRQIRRQPGWQLRVRAWFRPRRLVPAAGFAAVLIGGVLLLHRPNMPEQAALEADPIAQIEPQDYDVVADLDNLLATEDNNLWDDDDTSTL
jgi:hypothetical protein